MHNRQRAYLNGESPGFRSLVMFSKARPFLATKSANRSTTLCTSGSDGGGGGSSEAAAQRVSEGSTSSWPRSAGAWHRQGPPTTQFEVH